MATGGERREGESDCFERTSFHTGGFGGVSGAFKAEALVILTDTPGLLRAFPDESTLIERIPKGEAEGFMRFAEGRMKKKVLGAVEALNHGVGKVIFADGRIGEPISRALAGAGTHIG